MPVNPDDGARLAARVVDLLAQVELDLLRRVATTLRQDLDADDWSTRQIERIRVLRGLLEQDAARATPTVVAEVERIVQDAYTTGQALAVSDLDAAGIDPRVPPSPPGTLTPLVQAAQSQVRQALVAATVQSRAVFADAVYAGAAEVLGGRVTRVAAAQHVLDRLASQGITGFRDAGGRQWSLTSYSEMAVRTTSGQAAVAGHVDQLQSSGLDLVIVSDAPRECPLCRPWEGKVLSLGGRVGDVIEPNLTGGRGVRVKVAGTLDDARRAGFQHPNCRHSVSAYLPGATTRPEVTSDPEGYEATQRQRALERKVREWKRRQAVALDDETARRAAAKVRAWQAELREHVDANDLKRLRRREQIGTAT